MLKKHLNLFTFLCLCQFVFSQQSQEKFTQSLLSGDVASAIEHFEGIKNKTSLKSDIHYFATLAYAKNNDFKNAINHLGIAAKKGLTNIERFNDGSLDTLKTLDSYQEIITIINTNKELATQELKQLHTNLSYKFENTTTSKKIELEMTSVKHQGNRNTCSAFAATSIAEFLLKDEFGKNVDLSESYAYYISKKKALSNSFLKNAYEPVDGLAGYLALDGYNYSAIKEQDWPYEQQNWLQTNNNKCIKTNGVPALECFTGIPPENITRIDKKFKTIFIPFKDIGNFILNEKKPVIVNIWLYQNGINMQTGQLNLPPEGKEMLMGGHVVVLTGYDAEKEEYTFKNSWGNTWGNNGFGKMPKAYLEKHFEASKSIPFNLDATDEEKEYLAKVALGASLILE